MEDVEETRDGIERLLKSNGYRVDPARGQEEAVASARRVEPDLILVRLGGSAIDVTAIAVRIRERAALNQRVPIVIFCIESIAEGAELKIAGNVYLTRPDNFGQLRTLLGQLLNLPPSMC